MSTPNVPFKTPLGHDELRTRTHRLSQRHRTILLLVDGRRPLAEVLGMAQQAGSSISHFEDVLRMGLVELPIDVVAPDPVMTEPGALATLRTTAVEVAVPDAVPALEASEPEPIVLPMLTVQTPADAPGPVAAVTTDDAAMLPAALMVSPDDAAALRALQAVEPPAEAAVTLPAAPIEPPPYAQAPPEAFGPPASRAAAEPAPERPPFPPPPPTPARPVPATKRRRGQTAAQPSRAPAPAPERTMEPVTLSELAHVPAPEIPPPPVAAPDHAVVEQVRALLADTVRQNPPPFVSRVPTRVAGARTLQDMRDLVLDIERYLSARRPRAATPGLQQARELLGLGNTVVAEDSRSWRDDDDDSLDGFPTTR
jgi:hypothetical protein